MNLNVVLSLHLFAALKKMLQGDFNDVMTLVMTLVITR